jgi:uncharacterized protein
MTRSSPPSPAPPRKPCPICGRPAAQEYKPFCTSRCADVDLSRWLGGGYRIAIDDPDTDPESDDIAPPGRPREP